ncbi:polysaccharide biosynthesis/export family protein [Thalassotalea nanhaiensis]|uniref:Polysaccharide biosynthesis/export family protein n=1 Tax=Thalassotalea nanhaiensis TaxID=3065648 RepID=A0ABY9TLB8_9GAMM|nr:polysaccharide biosynthesis/export family protein [Colwelliaceae bacterium SQ345]
MHFFTAFSRNNNRLCDLPIRKCFLHGLLFLLSVMLCIPSVMAATDTNDQRLYRLDTGDVINISVFGEEDLSKQVLINNRGSINYPFLGELNVRGLTLQQIEEKITQGLKPDYLINPNVSVAIVTYRSFFIEGQVKNSGAYAYQPGLTIAKAVVLAGGFTERASKDKLFVVKANDPNHEEIRVSINTLVEPGDIITVKQSFF